MIPEHDSVDVFIGIGVGKTDHHAVAIDLTGKKLLDKPLPQDETKLRALINKSLATVEFSSWWTSRQRSVRCLWRSLGTWTSWLATCLALRRIADWA